jgi:inorganic pyrophosphatase
MIRMDKEINMKKNDIEDKLIVAKDPNKYNKDQIQALIEFQERFFDIEIITG